MSEPIDSAHAAEQAAERINETITALRIAHDAERRNLDRANSALERIVKQFADLNGKECERGCGQCIRCIACAGLGVWWGFGKDLEPPDGGIAATARKPK